MEGKPVSIRVNGSWHRIRPVERMLCLGGRAFSLKQVVHRKGGLIIGEGDTGKSTYAGLLAQALEQGGAKPVFVKLRSRPKLELPEVPEGETQTIIWDGLDEYPECAREIIDLTDGLDPNRYHVWVTSRPGPAASSIARSSLLEDVYHLGAFTNDDVLAIANSVRLDGRKFLEQVRGTHFESFVRKPGGAMILMQLFANGQLSGSSRTGLMELIMRDFARETRDGDSEVNPKLGYSEEQVVEATCWIAACLVLTGKDAVWTGAESECPANDIPLAKIPVRDYGIDLFKSALGLRLFEPLTGDRYRLAYSEMPPFLAGRWIAKNLSKDQIAALIPQDEEFFTEDHARVVAWASCYRPPIGRKWIGLRPDFFLSCHQLIADCGCKKFFGKLAENYYYSELCCPQDLLRHRAAELSGFDAFIEVLCGVIASIRSSPMETALAAVLLQDCAVGNRKVAKILTERLRDDPWFDELDTYRLVRAIRKVCDGERYPFLADLECLLKQPCKTSLAETIRSYVMVILGKVEPVAARPLAAKDPVKPDTCLMTEREVARSLEDNAVLEQTEMWEEPADEFGYPLPPDDESLIEEIYPTPPPDEQQEMSEDDWIELEDDRMALRKYLYSKRGYAYEPQDEAQNATDDIDGNPANRFVLALNVKGTLIDRIVENQEARGLAYYSLDRYFDERFVRQKADPFACPKLFTYALKQNPKVFLPILIDSVEGSPLVGLVYLAGLEKTKYAVYLTDALKTTDVFTVIRLYRIIIGGSHLFNGAFLQSVSNRILKEPTEEVEEALYGLYGLGLESEPASSGEDEQRDLDSPVDEDEDEIIEDEIVEAEEAEEGDLYDDGYLYDDDDTFFEGELVGGSEWIVDDYEEGVGYAYATPEPSDLDYVSICDIGAQGYIIERLVELNPHFEEINDTLIRRVSLARRLLDGKVMVTLEDLAGLGVEEKAQPASQNDVRTIVQAAASSIVQTVETLPAKTVEALKNRGGRPKNSERAAGSFTQVQIAAMFGAPCTAEKVANWEAKARGAKRGSNPPAATVDGVLHSYSQKLRENPTAENMAILAAIVRDYKSRVAVKQRLKDAPPIVHAKSEETSARMRGVPQEESRRLHQE